MNPNGKMFVVRAVLFAVCAVFLLSNLSNAATMRGTFKLPAPAHWGKMVLAPGDYEFIVDTDSASRMITIRSKDTGWSGMVMAVGLSDAGAASGSTLTLAKYEEGEYVQALYLKDAGVALNFQMPKLTMSKFAKSTSPTGTSASGSN
jgi:hypothetical protein